MAERPRGTELIVAGNFNVNLRKYGWPGTGLGGRGGGRNGSPRRSCGTLPPVTVGVVQVSEDVGGGESGEVSAVPDGLNPGIRPPYLP